MTVDRASAPEVPKHIVEMVTLCTGGSVGSFLSTHVADKGRGRVETACCDLLGWLLIRPVLKHPHPLEVNAKFERARDLCQLINSSAELMRLFVIADNNLEIRGDVEPEHLSATLSYIGDNYKPGAIA